MVTLNALYLVRQLRIVVAGRMFHNCDEAIETSFPFRRIAETVQHISVSVLLQASESVYRIDFLPRDARSIKRGIATVSRPFVRPSVCDGDVPWTYRLD